jgi:hypothetical protein
VSHDDGRYTEKWWDKEIHVYRGGSSTSSGSIKQARREEDSVQDFHSLADLGTMSI